jgi:hypothetical protein
MYQIYFLCFPILLIFKYLDTIVLQNPQTPLFQHWEKELFTSFSLLLFRMRKWLLLTKKLEKIKVFSSKLEYAGNEMDIL